MKRFLILFITVLVAACSTPSKKVEVTPAPIPLPTNLEEAVGNPIRSMEFTPRDKYRHPYETLKFLGIQNNMTVVEITPGAGWYTEILAPFLAKNGHYVAAVQPSVPSHDSANANHYTDWLSHHPQIASTVTTATFNPPGELALGQPGTADMVLTFRNVHNWMGKGNQDAVFKAFFTVLKPGGILGIEEHRGNPEKAQDPQAKSGYVREKDVIAMAKKAGFRLVAESEINANPRDTKDYPEGVWTLPPVYRLKDVDRWKYTDIGESDRMTLKFEKPLK